MFKKIAPQFWKVLYKWTPQEAKLIHGLKNLISSLEISHAGDHDRQFSSYTTDIDDDSDSYMQNPNISVKCLVKDHVQKTMVKNSVHVQQS
jgi:hypothetical protein